MTRENTWFCLIFVGLGLIPTLPTLSNKWGHSVILSPHVLPIFVISVLQRPFFRLRLEKLLKDAILHGAKLGRAKKELEEEVAHHKAEQGRLQRKMSQLTQEARGKNDPIGSHLKYVKMVKLDKVRQS